VGISKVGGQGTDRGGIYGDYAAAVAESKGIGMTLLYYNLLELIRNLIKLGLPVIHYLTSFRSSYYPPLYHLIKDSFS
jgi:hypothetical protein